ncbi:hypothetical protein ABZ635_06825 [Nocardiopsis sp. NPDC007018]|uniref:hypothetical protein n=1 Tax=Nocardiopsis sp. NPDC007018 TaxID=3155721 RepID=UPI0033EF1A6F
MPVSLRIVQFVFVLDLLVVLLGLLSFLFPDELLDVIETDRGALAAPGPDVMGGWIAFGLVASVAIFMGQLFVAAGLSFATRGCRTVLRLVLWGALLNQVVGCLLGAGIGLALLVNVALLFLAESASARDWFEE